MGSPLEALFPPTRRTLLVGFFRQPERRLYLREIQRLVGTGRGAVQRELGNLVEAGILRREKEHGRVYFQANTRSPLFADLRSLVDKTAGLTVVVGEAIRDVAGVGVAFIFGSIARGEALPNSDVDLAVVGNATFRAVVSALAEAQLRIGREVNPVVLTPDELSKRLKRQDHFVREVMASPKLFVVGTEDDLAAVVA